MRRNSFLAGIAVSTIAIGSTAGYSTPAQAAATEFFCGEYQGVPTTMARTAMGTMAVIRFQSEHFSDSGWTPERRCEAVSQRFNRFHQAGQLRYLTTGRKNGYNVICVATERGGSCLDDSVLFTVRPGRNPNKTLCDLLALRDGNTSPLNETGSRIYVSMDELLKQATPEKASSTPNRMPDRTPPSAPLPKAAPGTAPSGGLW